MTPPRHDERLSTLRTSAKARAEARAEAHAEIRRARRAEQGERYLVTVNGTSHVVRENKPLLRFLRDDLHIHSA